MDSLHTTSHGVLSCTCDQGWYVLAIAEQCLLSVKSSVSQSFFPKQVGWGLARGWESWESWPQLTKGVFHTLCITSCSAIKLGGNFPASPLQGNWLHISQVVVIVLASLVLCSVPSFPLCLLNYLNPQLFLLLPFWSPPLYPLKGVSEQLHGAELLAGFYPQQTSSEF